MEVITKVSATEARIIVKLPMKTGKTRRIRVYTEGAKRLLLEKHPRFILENVLQYCTVNNYGKNEGEWVFSLKEKEKPIPQKAPTVKKKTLKQLKEDARKDVV